MMWHDWNAMGIFGWTMMILFWVAVTFLVVWAIRAISAPSKDQTATDAAEILRRRYAAGEIERDEFEERLRVVEDSKRRPRGGQS